MAVDGAREQWGTECVIWPIVQVDVIKAMRSVCGCSEGVSGEGDIVDMAHRGASVTNCNLIVMHDDKGKNTEPVRQEQIKVCFIFYF